MRHILLLLSTMALAAACSSSAPVDVKTAMPGTWDCGDGLVIVLRGDGTYEWQIAAGAGGLPIPAGQSGGNEHMRINDDGSYAMLGQWRLNGSTLEIDMLGDTDRYSVAMSSPTALALTDDEQDTTSCVRK